MTRLNLVLCFLLLIVESSNPVSAQTPSREKVIIDTDVGDDIDDAFAIALALRSPELKILGITTTFGDTEMRAAILDRMLNDVGRTDVPVAIGAKTSTPVCGDCSSQMRYARAAHFVRPSHPRAVDFILDQTRRYPGQITLIAIGPLTNVGNLIARDPLMFRKLKRVVMMGGWFESIKPDYGNEPEIPHKPEWNVENDVEAAQKLIEVGVPTYLMPIDSTIQLKLDDAKRRTIFSSGTSLTEALALLYSYWSGAKGREGAVATPILYDAMAVAFVINPDNCSTRPIEVEIDARGLTSIGGGTPNANVCLSSKADKFFDLLMSRLITP